ncbi:CHAT domain-containing protein [Epilithonimonas sp. JDS]|nr:CHAT domain-containing protein [Epilithonimonas sp. JDS]
MIKIPKNRAIELLEARLNDLNNPKTDLIALKSRIKMDVESIFGFTSTQAMSIIGLSTLHFDDPVKITKIKTTFQQTLESFIAFINDFNIIDQEKIVISEEKFKELYTDLLDRWNSLVPDYNKLLEDYQVLHKKYDISLSEIKILEDKLDEKPILLDVIKILFLGASPIDEVRLRIDQEVRDIEARLKMATLRDSFDLKSEWAVTAQTLQQAMLERQPNIVHFSGHGDIDGIAIEDTLGNSKLLDNDALGSLFELFSDKVECVFLNSCYSESQASEIAKHIPYVIGMRSSVPDEAAIAFSTGFYSALGAGKDFHFAYKMGVVSIKLEGVTGSDIPVFIG